MGDKRGEEDINNRARGGLGTLEGKTHPDLGILLEEKLVFLKQSKQAREDAGIEKDDKFGTC